jgi:glyoxylase-like metal-dependent hydrolase (beta-lactamase superfamily II)/ferredoxin
MADLAKRLAENIDGLFFVDSTCIDCDTCRQLAPEVFADGNDSAVYKQPESDSALRNATRALLSCPTGSIGTIERIDTHSRMDDFPLLIDGDVYYNGFASKHSFGASSYVIQHPEGNWMIDSPKYMPNLVKKFETMGGLKYIFLSHQDDVADADRYAKYFGAKRIIHKYELRAQPDSEIILVGEEPVSFGSDFLVIPSPGHTRGHCVLLYKEHYLFTGDHLWWSRNRKSLIASRSVCWYSWSEQIHSMETLTGYDFDWVIPGHGERIQLPKEEMKMNLQALILRMKRQK